MVAFVLAAANLRKGTKREIRFQSKLINMQFVIPRVAPRFSFLFSLSLSLYTAPSLLRRVAREEDAIENSYTPRIFEALEFRDTERTEPCVYLKWMYRGGRGAEEGAEEGGGWVERSRATRRSRVTSL